MTADPVILDAEPPAPVAPPKPESTAASLPAARQRTSLVAKFADRFSIAPNNLMHTLKSTAFKQKKGEVSDEQMAALLIVADQYALNPFTREIFAFPDKQNGIVPVVSVDGWVRIINDHPMMDGLSYNAPERAEWEQIDADAKVCPPYIECVIFRKDRSKPIVVREYLDEVYRPLGVYDDGNKMKPGPWQTHTKRFLRHKATIQCARLAFGFAGIFDEDEAQRIVEREVDAPPPAALPVDGQPKTTALPFYPQDKFDAALDGWRGKLHSGKATPERIFQMVEGGGHALSDEQKRAITEAAPKQGDDE